MNIHPSIYTNHEWKNGSTPIFNSINPATNEILWLGNGTGIQEINEVVNNARNAFKTWSGLTIDQRSAYLNRFAEVLEKELDSFAVVISKETGKPLWEAKGEIKTMINKIEISISAYGIRCPNVLREQGQARHFTRHLPHGVIAVLGPFNFPGHLPNGHIIPALLAGNTVIFKPSELTPLAGEKMMQCWEKVNLPHGVINMVQGGPEVGQALINNSDIDGLFFTGSYKTGALLSTAFGPYPEKLLVLELGGNNSLLIGSISDPTTAAYLTIQSAFLSSGQRCSCARRLIVIEGEMSEIFINTLVDLTKKIIIGAYNSIPEPYMGPVIREFHADRILKNQDDLKKNNGKLLLEMKKIIPGTAFISPGIMDVTSVQNRVDEEIFGPFLQIIRVKDLSEGILEANNTKYGLSAGIFSDLESEYEEFYQNVRAGVVNWNNALTGASSFAPFGGLGRSGNHRPSAFYAADYCANPIVSLESPKLHSLATPPPGLMG